VNSLRSATEEGE